MAVSFGDAELMPLLVFFNAFDKRSFGVVEGIEDGALVCGFEEFAVWEFDEAETCIGVE